MCATPFRGRAGEYKWPEEVATTATIFPAPRRARSARPNSARCGRRDTNTRERTHVWDRQHVKPDQRRLDVLIDRCRLESTTAHCRAQVALHVDGEEYVSETFGGNTVDALRPAVDRPQHRRRCAVETHLGWVARRDPHRCGVHSRIRHERKVFGHGRTGGHACGRVSARTARYPAMLEREDASKLSPMAADL